MTDNTLDKMSKLDADIARKTYYPEANKKDGYIGRPMMYVDDVMKIIADREKEMVKEIDDIAESLSIPSITTWKQGEFIDSPKYSKMGERWKYEQEEREKTLIRPGGGTNNALFQISGYVDNEVIAEYLEAVGKVLRQRAKEWRKKNG